MKITTVIELDDITHTDPERDRNRDRMLAAAGYKVIRFSSRTKPVASDLANIFEPAEPPAAL